MSSKSWRPAGLTSLPYIRLRDTTAPMNISPGKERPERRPYVAPVDSPGIYGTEAIQRISRELPLVERLYASIRFSILRPKLLTVMDLLLPEEGNILDIGCGFGLFAAYFGQTNRGRSITGVDPDARRIDVARRVARNLQLKSHQFIVGDARSIELDKKFDAAYVLDVMHHIPEADQLPMLASLERRLEPGGILILKDITTSPYLKLKFTEYLDRMMVGWNEPLAYRHHYEWAEMLRTLDFKVRVVLIPDILPYPHVVIAARKPI